MEDLNGKMLFESMFLEDSEASKLAQLPGMADLLAVYEDKFASISVQLYEFGLGERIKRRDETDSFLASMKDAFDNNKQGSVKHIETFEKLKTKVYHSIV